MPDLFTVAVVQQKGGSGKTSIAVNLAAFSHLSGFRTLLLDMDPQATAFDWGTHREEGSELDGIKVEQAAKALLLPQFEKLTRGYQVVILDGTPRRGDITESAAVAADVVVLPVTPGPADFWSLSNTLESIDQADLVRHELGRAPVRRAFVLNRANAGRVLTGQAETGLRAAGELAGIIREREAYRASMLVGESVFTWPSRAAAASSSAASDIKRLWQKLQKGSKNHEKKRLQQIGGTRPPTASRSAKTNARLPSALVETDPRR